MSEAISADLKTTLFRLRLSPMLETLPEWHRCPLGSPRLPQTAERGALPDRPAAQASEGLPAGSPQMPIDDNLVDVPPHFAPQRSSELGVECAPTASGRSFPESGVSVDPTELQVPPGLPAHHQPVDDTKRLLGDSG